MAVPVLSVDLTSSGCIYKLEEGTQNLVQQSAKQHSSPCGTEPGGHTRIDSTRSALSCFSVNCPSFTPPSGSTEFRGRLSPSPSQRRRCSKRQFRGQSILPGKPRSLAGPFAIRLILNMLMSDEIFNRGSVSGAGGSLGKLVPHICKAFPHHGIQCTGYSSVTKTKQNGCCYQEFFWIANLRWK